MKNVYIYVFHWNKHKIRQGQNGQILVLKHSPRFSCTRRKIRRNPLARKIHTWNMKTNPLTEGKIIVAMPILDDFCYTTGTKHNWWLNFDEMCIFTRICCVSEWTSVRAAARGPFPVRVATEAPSMCAPWSLLSSLSLPDTSLKVK